MALDTFCNEKTRCAVYGETFCEITQLPLIHCVFCLKKRTAISVLRTILGEGGRVGLRTPLIDAVDRKSSTFAPKYAKKGDQTELEWEKHGDTGPNYGKNYKGKEFNNWVVQGARTDLERGVMGAEDADVWVVAMVPTVEDAALLGVCGLIAGVGSTLIVFAYRTAGPGSIGALEYSAMLWAVLWGWAFFGDLPTPATLAGAALIIASGIYAVTRPAPEPHPRR